jgi:hypothetical protein
VITAVVKAPTAVVVTVNVADVEPAITVTEAGTVALLMLEASATAAPPVGAGPLKVTVPVDELPPITDVGLSLTPIRPAGVMLS